MKRILYYCLDKRDLSGYYFWRRNFHSNYIQEVLAKSIYYGSHVTEKGILGNLIVYLESEGINICEYEEGSLEATLSDCIINLISKGIKLINKELIPAAHIIDYNTKEDCIRKLSSTEYDAIKMHNVYTWCGGERKTGGAEMSDLLISICLQVKKLKRNMLLLMLQEVK